MGKKAGSDTMPQSFMPSFLCIGATKAGTTWLYHQLRQHPDVYVLPEVHYFDRSPSYPSPNKLAKTYPWQRLTDKKTKHGIAEVCQRIIHGDSKEALTAFHRHFGIYNDNWYIKLFSHAEVIQRGDITPAYSILEDKDVSRIKIINADVKLIFLMRNPIDRAWSNYRHNIKLGLNSNTSDESKIIRFIESPGQLLRSDYERTIDTYLRHFPSEQVLLGFYDALSADPVGLINSICSFLDIREDLIPIDQLIKRINVSPDCNMPDTIKDYLYTKYRPMIERLSQRFGSYSDLWLADMCHQPVASTKLTRKLEPAINPC